MTQLPFTLPGAPTTASSSLATPAVASALDTPMSDLPVKRSPALRKEFKQRLPELLKLERLMRQHPEWLQVKLEQQLEWRGRDFPIYSISLGNPDTDLPVVLLTGGVHGVERIGSQVLIAWLQTLLTRLDWDESLRTLLQRLHLVLVPLVNPVGMFCNSRCNGNGVDLNRNAPVEAEAEVPWLGGGHRLGPWLPWYRGSVGAPMEVENVVLERLVRRQVLNHPLALVLDLHSGFGMRDRLWLPYANCREPIDNIANYFAFKMLWERTYPHHDYLIEPQSLNYLSHGDLWDYFYLQAQAGGHCNFMPLTLEMGSWAWVKKRPRQLLNFAGLFNPQLHHRHARVLRRHLLLLDFFLAAAVNAGAWLPDAKQRAVMEQSAHNLWFKSQRFKAR